MNFSRTSQVTAPSSRSRSTQLTPALVQRRGLSQWLWDFGGLVGILVMAFLLMFAGLFV